MSKENQKAVVLISGGLDSTTALAIAKNQGFDIYAMSFSYGQRHHIEIDAASNIAQFYLVKEHKIVHIDLRAFGGSALTDEIDVPKGRNCDAIASGIPITYVPARNTIFLAYALAWAEVLKAWDIFIGVNAVDYSGYPDCRPEFVQAFQDMANIALKATTEGKGGIRIQAPLINMSKSEIILAGKRLDIDYGMTRSCYDPDPLGKACGHCDSCILRKKGFLDAGVQDPTIYV